MDLPTWLSLTTLVMMKLLKLAAAATTLAGLLVSLTACEQKILWQKPDMSRFQQDDYACTKDAYDAGDLSIYHGMATRIPNRSLYIQCMQAHGYAQVQAPQTER